MSLLTVQNLGKSFQGEELFEGVTFRLEWNQKLGLVGRNGSGKTTLLRIITKQLEADKGTLHLGPGVRFGYLRQEDNVDPERSVLQEAELAFEPVAIMERALRSAEQKMASPLDPDDLDRVMQEYAQVHDRFEAMGGYENLRDIPSVLKRLGFSQSDQEKLCGKLSGGEKTRLGIARLLLSGPDILFLDEPTNHLDIEATEWLESFLKDYGGALVLVSHDRTFLDRVVTSIAEIEHKKLTLYTGNYSAYLQQKEANRLRQQELHDREQADIARFTEFFEKWRATPTKRAQAFQRLKWAEKLKSNATEKPLAGAKTAILGIKTEQRSGEDVASLDRVAKKYGDRTLFENISLHLRRGDRLGVVGPNGAGKSTLIKILLGQEQPTAGTSRLGTNLTIGYFAQDTGDLDLDATVLDNIMDVQEMTPQQARTHLGRFLFSGDDVFRQVRMLSGGEKNKLVLAQLTLMHPNLLILDEPTNHLDIESREALVQMLQQYNGTLILISHDRYLLDQVATRMVEIGGGAAKTYDGTYAEFREARTLTSPAVSSAPRSPAGSKTAILPKAASAPALNAHALSKERRRAQAEMQAAEERVGELELELGRIETALSQPAPGDDLVMLARSHGKVQVELDTAVAAWEKAAEYAEAL